MALTIRDATTADEAGIDACLRAAFEPYRGDYTAAAFADTVPDVAGIRDRRRHMTIVVAVDDTGAVSGTIGYEDLENGDAHVRGMAVQPAHQGEGVARRLLDLVERRLGERGSARILLDTTAPLARAVAVYRQGGFQPTGRVSDFHGMPLFEYMKALRPLTYLLAQVNLARAIAPIDSPQLAEFVARLDDINALADAAPGFVWRLKGEAGDATSIRAFDDDRILVNMSVWTSPEALHAFVYRTAHVEVMRRRREWFERMTEPFMAMWWTPAGRHPAIDDAKARLAHLAAHGDTAFAFSPKRMFPAPAASPTPTSV